jgi:hypothetical protein
VEVEEAFAAGGVFHDAFGDGDGVGDHGGAGGAEAGGRGLDVGDAASRRCM